LFDLVKPTAVAAKLPISMINWVSGATAQLLWNLVKNPTFGAESNSAAGLKCRQAIEEASEMVSAVFVPGI
jgi:hypothetical protein